MMQVNDDMQNNVLTARKKSQTTKSGTRKLSRDKSNRSRLWLQVFIIGITLAAVAVVIFLGNQTYHETRKIAAEQFNRQQLILARSAAAGIEYFIRDITDDLNSLSKLPEIRKMDSGCLAEIENMYTRFPPKTSIRRIDRNGILRFIYPHEDWRGKLVGQDFSGQDYFQKAGKTRRIAMSGLLVNEIGDKRIRIAKPLFSEKRNGAREFAGLLVASFDLKTLNKHYIAPVVSGKTGYAWLLGEDGILLAHNENGFAGRNAFKVRVEKNPDIEYKEIEQIQRQMMAGKEGVGHYVSGWHREQKGEIDKLVAYTPIQINNRIWSAAVCAPVSEVEEIIRNAYRLEMYTVSIVILMFLISGFCIFMIAFRWSHSLEQEVARRTGELRETSNYLNNIIEYVNAPIIVWNKEKQVTIFNKAFEDMSGWTEAEMMEQPLDVLFPGDCSSDSMKKIERTLKGEYWKTVEIPIQHRNGEIRIGLWNSSNIYNEDGTTLIATIAQGTDITERKRIGEALRVSEVQYRTTIDSMSDAIHLVTPDLRFTLVNQAHKQYVKELGGGMSDYLGYTIFEVFPSLPEEIREKLRAEYDLVFRTGETLIIEENMTFGKKEFATEIRKTPIFKKNKVTQIVTVIRDITRRKRLEKQLLQAQKMEAVGTLAAGIAHDFNNLLVPILGFTDLVLSNLSPENKSRKDLKQVLKAGVRARELVAQILTFSRQSESKRKPINLTTIVKEVLKLLRATLPATIEIRQIIESKTETINADPIQMHQILMNLCLNAEHAMPEGGVLKVSLSNIELDKKACTNFDDLKPGFFNRLSVKDTGFGMDEKTVERIFDPFFTTKGHDLGTGMGLSVVHGIVRSHGGDISVHSQPGAGTTFHIYLPVARSVAKVQPPIAKAIQGGSESILFVDDEAAIIEIGKKTLERLGYSVTAIASSTDALELFRQKPQKFDLVITDQTMPHTTGAKLAAEFLRIRPDIPIILCTGYSAAITQNDALKLGIRKFVMKPIVGEELGRTVRQVLDESLRKVN